MSELVSNLPVSRSTPVPTLLCNSNHQTIIKQKAMGASPIFLKILLWWGECFVLLPQQRADSQKNIMTMVSWKKFALHSLKEEITKVREGSEDSRKLYHPLAFQADFLNGKFYCFVLLADAIKGYLTHRNKQILVELKRKKLGEDRRRPGLI